MLLCFLFVVTALSNLVIMSSKFGKDIEVCIIKFQEKNLNLNRDSNSDLHISSPALYHWAILVQLPLEIICQDSLMVEHRAGDLEVRVRVPVQVQIFLLKFDNVHL